MIPKMRTVDQTIVWLQQMDPDTALTKTALRRLIKTKQIHPVEVGSKYLIDLDELIAFLKRGSSTENE